MLSRPLIQIESKMACRLPSLLKARGHLPCSPPSICNIVKPIQVIGVCGTTGVQRQWSQCYQTHLTRGLPCLANGGGMVAGWGRVERRRWASTKAAEGEAASSQQPSLFQKFWRWLHDLDDIERWDNPPDSQTQAELDEREAFLNRVQAMYFADPPQTPDLQFCRESLEMLIKYDDRVAVETLWNILPELKVEPDEELETRVRLYLKKARLESYYD